MDVCIRFEFLCVIDTARKSRTHERAHTPGFGDNGPRQRKICKRERERKRKSILEIELILGFVFFRFFLLQRLLLVVQIMRKIDGICRFGDTTGAVRTFLVLLVSNFFILRICALCLCVNGNGNLPFFIFTLHFKWATERGRAASEPLNGVWMEFAEIHFWVKSHLILFLSRTTHL